MGCNRRISSAFGAEKQSQQVGKGLRCRRGRPSPQLYAPFALLSPYFVSFRTRIGDSGPWRNTGRGDDEEVEMEKAIVVP